MKHLFDYDLIHVISRISQNVTESQQNTLMSKVINVTPLISLFGVTVLLNTSQRVGS